MMKTSPYLFLGLAITLSVISFGMVLRNLERYFNYRFILILLLEQSSIEMENLIIFGIHFGLS